MYEETDTHNLLLLYLWTKLLTQTSENEAHSMIAILVPSDFTINQFLSANHSNHTDTREYENAMCIDDSHYENRLAKIWILAERNWVTHSQVFIFAWLLCSVAVGAVAAGLRRRLFFYIVGRWISQDWVSLQW